MNQKVSRAQWHAVSAGFLGWTLDAFDFFVVVFLVDILAEQFRVGKSGIVWTLTATLATRPLGAFLFGLLADRFGRRVPLMANVIFFSAVELLCGFAPNYTVFLILRALYGIGMGGEWGVGASLAMEMAPRRWRGVLSGILQSGYSIGYLLAAVATRFVLPHLGWRAMFWIGGIPALLALYIRSKVPESEAWRQNRARSVRDVFRAIAGERYWRLLIPTIPMSIWVAALVAPDRVSSLLHVSWIPLMLVAAALSFATMAFASRVLAYLMVMMTLMMFLSHGTQDLYPDFLKSAHHFSSNVTATVVVIFNIGAVVGAIAFGHFSEKIGRRYSMIAALALSLLVLPAWAFGSSLSVLIIGSFLMQAGVQGAWGIIPAHLNELAPGVARGLVPGMAYQLGILFAAPTNTIEYLLRDRFGYNWALAGFEIGTILLLSLTLALGTESHGRDFLRDVNE